MRRGLPRPTPSPVAVMLQISSLLVVAGGLVVILISDINRHQNAQANVEPSALVTVMHP